MTFSLLRFIIVCQQFLSSFECTGNGGSGKLMYTEPNPPCDIKI